MHVVSKVTWGTEIMFLQNKYEIIRNAEIEKIISQLR